MHSNLTQANLPLNVAKTAWVCSNKQVEKALAAYLQEGDPEIRDLWKDLGIDSAGGKRRRVTTHSSMFSKAAKRSRRLQVLGPSP